MGLFRFRNVQELTAVLGGGGEVAAEGAFIFSNPLEHYEQALACVEAGLY